MKVLRARAALATRQVFEMPGTATLAAYLGNEFLMGITPWWPVPWAVPYFPVRAVGIAFIGLLEGVRLLGSAASEPNSRQIKRLVLGWTVIGVTVCVNYLYDGVPLFDLLERGGANGLAADKLPPVAK